MVHLWVQQWERAGLWTRPGGIFQDCSQPGGPAESFLRSELLLIDVLSIPGEARREKKKG